MLAQALLLEKVVANFHTIDDQYRDPRVVQLAQFGIRIDIHAGDIKIEFRAQALQRLRHIGTQMAALPDINGQLPRQEFTTCRLETRLIVIRYFHGKKGRAATALHQ